jgi:hypothetical protein
MIRQLGKQGLKARPYNPDLGTPFRKPVNELTLAELRRHYGYTLRQTTLGDKKIITYDLKLARIHNFQKKTPTIDGVIAWTIDKPEEMRELIRLGVSGMLTNRPDLLSKVVESWK